MNEEKTPDYYSKIGLKCGLEIHKRLDTKKLFCNCSTNMCGKRTCSITRKLNMSVGELGEHDEVAKKEVGKEKIFEYVCFDRETCLVDIDEEPPHLINNNALDIVLDLCLKFNCLIPKCIHIMRKTVLDGSNTSGFQRTALVGTDGNITPLDDKTKEIGIDSVCIEEESAQIEKDKEQKRTYLLNRLGIPLVEITTNAFFTTPAELKEIALHIGMLLNSTEKVKRGIGTIRQDVNISIAGGNRVELKGVQDVRKMDKVTDLEIQRQQSLIKLKETLQDKKITFKDIFDAKEFFSNTKSAIFTGKEAYGFVIGNFGGKFSGKLNDIKTLGNEIAKIACVGTNAKGIIHTDEDLKKYKLTDEFKQIRKHFKLSDKDLILCVATNQKNAKKVFEQLQKRVMKLKKGVRKETRAVLANCDSVYMRPIAGAKRMYPETDIPKIRISKKYLIDRKKNLFETYEEKKEFYKRKLNIPDETINQIINLKMNTLFDELIKSNSFKNKEKDASKLIISFSGILAKIQTEYDAKTAIKSFEECFIALQNNKITKQGAGIFLKEKLKNPAKPETQILKENNLEKLSKGKLVQIIEEAKGQTKNTKEIIRFIESKYSHRIDKKELIELLIKK